MFFLADTKGDKEILGQFARSENVEETHSGHDPRESCLSPLAKKCTTTLSGWKEQAELGVVIPANLVRAFSRRNGLPSTGPQLFWARKSKRNFEW